MNTEYLIINTFYIDSLYHQKYYKILLIKKLRKQKAYGVFLSFDSDIL